MEAMTSEMLHEHLKNIDPISANRIHPRNRRKIIRYVKCEAFIYFYGICLVHENLIFHIRMHVSIFLFF